MELTSGKGSVVPYNHTAAYKLGTRGKYLTNKIKTTILNGVKIEYLLTHIAAKPLSNVKI
jgi:hypothetical protein